MEIKSLLYARGEPPDCAGVGKTLAPVLALCGIFDPVKTGSLPPLQSQSSTSGLTNRLTSTNVLAGYGGSKKSARTAWISASVDISVTKTVTLAISDISPSDARQDRLNVCQRPAGSVHEYHPLRLCCRPGPARHARKYVRPSPPAATQRPKKIPKGLTTPGALNPSAISIFLLYSFDFG